MNSFNRGNSFNSSLLLIFLIFFQACTAPLIKYLHPKNEILHVYTSPQINNYTLRKIAILPMAQDDTTDTGTYYFTNHLVNLLGKKFPELDFYIPDYSPPELTDSLIPVFIDSIEKLKRFDLRSIYSSGLSESMEIEKPDAILIGNYSKLLMSKGYSTRYPATQISCEVSNYLISMREGRVLWKAVAQAEEGYYLLKDKEVYPPLDYAISNGIDKILDVIKFGKFER